MMTVGSLFSGIGGIDLGLQRAGFEIKWQVETDEYCQKVLAKHWPDVARYGDIRTVGKHNLQAVDLLAGGFPCQDISIAGKRAGITGERSGLWKEFYRLICELRPRFVLVENVAAILNWGIDTVLGDLASCGYDAEWQVLSAAAFGAPHIRERAFIVAYTTSEQDRWVCQRRIQPDTFASRQDVAYAMRKRSSSERNGRYARAYDTTGACSEDVSDTAIKGLPFRRYPGLTTSNTQARAGLVFQSQRHSGIEQSEWWAVEPNVGRVAHGIPARVDRLKALGNAVVPQIAEYIGRCILEVAS